MERLNDRDIDMTERDCQLLVQHIVGRQRNGVPLPFPEEFGFDNGSCESPTVSDQGSTRKKGPRKPMIRWRCFVRTVSALGYCSRLVLTFIPANFTQIKEMRRHEKKSSTGSSSSKSIPDKSQEMAESKSEELESREGTLG